MNRFALGILGCAVAAATPLAAQDVAISLGDRTGRGVPTRCGFTHTGGGNIQVSQPSPDTLVVTATGVAVAGGHPTKDSAATMTLEAIQNFDVVINKKGVTKAKLTLQAQLVGLLRSHSKGGGTSQIDEVSATIASGGACLLNVALPSHSASCGSNVSINDLQSPPAAYLNAGSYTLRQAFKATALHPRRLAPCKAASAEFAPDPALDPLWISYWEPFHGADKKSFGFQVTIKVAADDREPAAATR